jgi:predicted GIY-YIG superfamily endonuclease
MKYWKLKYYDSDNIYDLPTNQVISGVYLLQEEGGYYVGSSVNVYDRYKHHKQKKKLIMFDNNVNIVILENFANYKYPYNTKGWLIVKESIWWDKLNQDGFILTNKAPFLFLTNKTWKHTND